MTMMTQSGSATIYQFPVRKVGGRQARATSASIAELAGARLATVEFGSGWYHEAAMEEERAGKNDGH